MSELFEKKLEMKLSKTLGTLACVVIAASCLNACKSDPNKNSKDESVLPVLINEKRTFLSPDSIFESVEYIPLETLDESIFYEIDKTVLEKDVFYILDRKADVILAFGRTGKFLGKLSRKGSGPEEYLSIDDFFISDDLIYLLSQDNRRIYIYDLSFNFKEYFDIHTHASNISYTDSDIYVYTAFASRDLNNIYVIDRESKEIKHKYGKFLEKQLGVSYRSTAFALHNNVIYSFYPYDYSIYKLDRTGQEKYIELDFDKDNIYPDFFRDLSDDERTEYDKNRYSDLCDRPIGGIDNLYISDNFLYFTFVFNCLEYSFLLDKNRNKDHVGYIFSSHRFPFFSSNHQTIVNDCMITYISPEVIKNIIEHPQNKNITVPSGIFEGLSVTDNPVLCIYKLKNS